MKAKQVLSFILSTLMISTGFSMPVRAAEITDGTVGAAAVYISGGTLTWGDYELEINDGNTVTITKYNGSDAAVTVPDNIYGAAAVTGIGANAFKNCTKIKTVTVPNSVTSIGVNAFSGCSMLSDITIPSSVTSIGSKAFVYCTRLTSITIPKNVETIGSGAFLSCSSLNDISVEEGNTVFTLTDGSLYNIPEKKLVRCPVGITSFTIPEETLTIDSGAFSSCSQLSSITIPKNVETIGENAFNYCVRLETIIIPDSVVNLGGYAFKNCTSLTGVRLSKNITAVSDGTFHYCSGIKTFTVPDGVQSIGSSAFIGCTALTDIYLPRSINKIDYDSFGYSNSSFSNDCKNLKNVYYGGSTDEWSKINIWNNNDFLINASRYYNSTMNLADLEYEELSDGTLKITKYNGVQSDVTIPETIDGKTVAVIGEDSFRECTSVENVTLPDTVTSIGEYSFFACSGLQSINMPASVTTIGDAAFFKCKRLKQIDLPERLTSIGTYAFASCTGLTTVTIPQNVTVIGDDAFASCSGLIRIDADSKNTVFSSVDGVLYNKDKTALAAFPGGKTTAEIPDGVTVIKAQALAVSPALTSVQLPASISSIEYGAFYNCENLKDVYYKGSNDDWNNLIPNIAGDNDSLLNADLHFIAENTSDTETDSADEKTGFKGTFIIENGTGTVNVYNTQDYTKPDIENAAEAYARDAETGEIVTDGTGQINFMVIPDPGYAVETVLVNGDYKNLKTPEDLSTENAYRITKVQGNLTIKIVILESETEPADTTVEDTSKDTATSDDTSTEKPEDTSTAADTSTEKPKDTSTAADTSTEKPEDTSTAADTSTEKPKDTSTAADTSTEKPKDTSADTDTSTDVPSNTDNDTDTSTDTDSNTDTDTSTDTSTDTQTETDVPTDKDTDTQKDTASDVKSDTEIPDETVTDFVTDSDSVVERPSDEQTERDETDRPPDDSAASTDPTAHYLDSDLEPPVTPDSDFNYDKNDDGTFAVVRYTGYNAVITIPREHDGKPVTSIVKKMKYQNESYGHVVRVFVPDSVTEIGSKAFSDYTGLKMISIPDSVEKLGDNAFYNCSSLTDIEIPSSVTSIGASAFSNCRSLESVALPNSVKTIGQSAFYQCESLKEITIPNSVTEIPTNAFKGCINLKSITVPLSVTKIGENVFDVCQSLTDVYYEGTKEQWESIENRSNNGYLKDATIHFAASTDVPADTDSGTGTDSATDTDTVKSTLYGDVDGDGKISAKDSMNVQRFVIKLKVLNESQQKAAEINGDGKVTNKDALEILRYTIHMSKNALIGQKME